VRSFALVISLAALPLGAPSVLAQDPRADRLLARAEREVERRRPSRAAATLRRAANRGADPAAVARLALRLIPEDGACPPWLRDALVAPDDPTRDEARALALGLARCDAASGSIREAVARATPAVGLQDGAGVSLLRQLAAQAIREGAFDAAESALRVALRSMPQDPELALDLAALLRRRGRAPQAIAVLLELVERRPDFGDARRALGLALLAAGREDEALSTLADLARRADGDERRDALLDLSSAALEAGRRSRAHSAARDAHALGDPDGRAALGMGLALAAMGRRAEARDALEEALSKRPGDTRARGALRGLGDANAETP